MPKFPGECQLAHQWMRDRECLSELRPVNASDVRNLFCDNPIGIHVKFPDVEAYEQKRGLTICAKVQLGSRTGIQTPEVTERNCWPGPFTFFNYRLQSGKDLAGMMIGPISKIG